MWECGYDLEPAALFSGYVPHFTCHFGQVLILAEDHGDIQSPVSGHAHDIET